MEPQAVDTKTRASNPINTCFFDMVILSVLIVSKANDSTTNFEVIIARRENKGKPAP